MIDVQTISPLLDHLTVEETLPERSGCACFGLRNEQGERFILKRLAYPADNTKIQALLLSGAYPDEAAVHSYYGALVADVCRELDSAKALSESGRFLGPVGYQSEAQPGGIGYYLYVLYPRLVPLSGFVVSSEMSNLRAVNLGIDLCDSLEVCRDNGFLLENLKPDNIFLTPTGRFIPGDLGLAPLEDLEYASVPENYLGAYSAPELFELAASPNRTIDLYSLGMVLYHVYNGAHAPFRDENTDEAMAEKLRLTGKPLPTPLYADYEMAALILKACAFKPEERFQTPDVLKQALTFYMQRNHISDTPIVPPLVVPAEPIDVKDEQESGDEPIRMTHAEDLDETFRKSFSPDLNGGGSDTPDTAPAAAAGAAGTPVSRVTASADDAPPSDSEEAQVELQKDAPQTTPALPPELTQRQTAGEELDALLADVSRHIENKEEILPEEKGTAQTPQPSTEEEYAYVDAEEVQPPKKRSKTAPLLIAGILVLMLAAAVWFGLKWYFVSVRSVTFSDFTADGVQFVLDSDDAPEHFSIVCADQSGKTYPVALVGGVFRISGLSEKTRYVITVSAAEHHRLSGESENVHVFTTPQVVAVEALRASAGENDGEVLITVASSISPDTEWELLVRSADGSDEKSLRFDGSTVLVSGLKTRQEYIFTLQNSDRMILEGGTQTSFTPLPVVRVTDLKISAIDGYTVTLSWTPGDNLPDNWTVRCTADGMDGLESVVRETSCTFTLPDLTHEYTFTLNADGMLAEVQTVLAANPTVLGDLKAELQEDGTLVLSWRLISGRNPESWTLSYGLQNAQSEPLSLSGSDTTLTLSGLVPDADYVFRVQANGVETLYGNTELTYRTPQAERFTAYGIQPTPPYSSMWYCPEKASWNYGDLAQDSTVFSASDKLALCIQVRSMNGSNDLVRFDYLVRDGNGTVVSQNRVTGVWSSLWLNRRHTAEVENPGASGSYTVEVYVNGRLLVSTPFEIR